MNEIITDDGVIIEQISGTPAPLVDNAMASALARAEIDTQVATARRYPRSIKNVIDNILSLTTLDEETATECIYALKRSGKPIRGPSIRLAEIIAGQWGNCRDGATIVAIDRVNKIITAEGFFHDLETNRGTRASVQRRISDGKGRLFSDDMITVTGNAACSIARRNAILAGVPKGVWRKAVEAAEQIIRGDAKTLVERRDTALKSLMHFNLSSEQVFKVLDVKGIEDIGLDDLATMRVIYSALKNGEQTVEELLRGIEPEKPQRITAATAPAERKPDVFTDDVITPDAKPSEPVKKPDSSVSVQGNKTLDNVASSQHSEPAKEPAKEDLFAEPDDLDIIINDTIAEVQNAKSVAEVERIFSEARELYDQAGAKQKSKLDQAFAAAHAGAKKRKAS